MNSKPNFSTIIITYGLKKLLKLAFVSILVTKNSFVYEGMYIVCFCLYLWDPLNEDASNHILSLFGKLSMRRGARAWFLDVWICSANVCEYWMIFSLKIKLNHSKNIWRNWNVPLVLLETSWWVGSNIIYLLNFGFKMWEILILKCFLQLKIEINSKKPSFGRKYQLKMW
jgi:hypothetical protein